MRCTQVRESLQDSLRNIRSLKVWPHLVHCSACRAEARSVRRLGQAVREAGRLEVPADLLPAILAVPSHEAPARTQSGQGRRMRRLAFAGAAILIAAVGIGVLIPGMVSKPDAHSILTGVAHAMEKARSLHVVFRGVEEAKDAPTGMRMFPGRVEFWLSSRAIYGEAAGPDGALLFAAGADVDTREMWVYDTDERTRYVADLGPVEPEAAAVIAGASRLYLSNHIMDTIGKVFPDGRESVETERRDGRDVLVVTVTGTLKTSPRRVTGRNVFEIDAATNHLLGMRQYASVPGSPEELVQTIDEVEYDAPMPAVGQAFAIPAGARTVRATATIEETGNNVALVMKSGDHVLRYEVPREE